MRIMFEAIIVTNETSYVPTGHGNGDEIGEGDVAGNDVAGNDDGEIGGIGTSTERRAEKRLHINHLRERRRRLSETNA